MQEQVKLLLGKLEERTTTAPAVDSATQELRLALAEERAKSKHSEEDSARLRKEVMVLLDTVVDSHDDADAKKRKLDTAARMLPVLMASVSCGDPSTADVGVMTMSGNNPEVLKEAIKVLETEKAAAAALAAKAEKERMAAEENAKAMQRETERMRKWAEVQVENNKKEFEGVCKREAKLSELVKEKDDTIRTLTIERDARLTLEVRGLFFCCVVGVVGNDNNNLTDIMMCSNRMPSSTSWIKHWSGRSNLRSN